MLCARSQLRQLQSLSCRLASGQSGAPQKSPPASAAAAPAAATPPADDTPVGPGAAKAGAYKNPEYYKYSPMSYFDLEVDMKNDRLVQPSSKK